MLELRAISKRYGGVVATDDVTLDVVRGEVHALIGPNGAGKTTIFNMIAGVYAPDAGEIVFDGEPIHGLRPHQVCAAGIGRTFQIVKPFAGLTVLDNVMVGAFLRSENAQAARKLAGDIVERLGLGPKRDLPASSLTLPDRKRLEVARALATRPKLLLLDEVMAGLRPTEIDTMVATFRDLVRETGLTILLTEHVMRTVMALSDRVVVLNYGQKIAEGAPDAVARDPRVLESYLGSAGAPT